MITLKLPDGTQGIRTQRENRHRYVPHHPLDNQVPFFLADFADEKGNPLYVCPRQVLKKVVDSAKKMGYEAAVGLEFEWFNFQETPQTWSEKRYHHPTP